MKIIHIIGTLNTGGIQKYLLQLINTSPLNNYQHQILCTISSEGNFRCEYEAKKIDITYFPFTYLPTSYLPFKIDKLFRGIYSRAFFFRFWSYLLKSESHVIHSHIQSHIISQILATIISGKKFVWTIHGEYKLHKLTQIIIRILQSFIPVSRLNIIGDSNHAIKNTLPYVIKKNSKGEVIPTGIDLIPFLKKNNSFDLRQKYNIHRNTTLIGSTGRIVWQKGFDQLITLLHNYNFSKQVHFIIAGDGSLKNQYIQEIQKTGISDQISFVGNIKDIPKFLSNLDIYIQPSITEGFPLSVLEAMASGLPVICSDAGGLKEMIHHEENGIIYKSQDLKSLYKSLYQLLSMSPDKLCQLGEKAMETVQNQYSINYSSKQYEILYKK